MRPAAWREGVAVAMGVLAVVHARVGACAARSRVRLVVRDEGAGEGELQDPTGVAVDEESGEVYVVDAGKNGSRCIGLAAGGYEYVSQFKVHSPGAIAVDNSRERGDPSRGMCLWRAGKKKRPNRTGSRLCVQPGGRQDRREAAHLQGR